MNFLKKVKGNDSSPESVLRSFVVVCYVLEGASTYSWLCLEMEVVINTWLGRNWHKRKWFGGKSFWDVTLWNPPSLSKLSNEETLRLCKNKGDLRSRLGDSDTARWLRRLFSEFLLSDSTRQQIAKTYMFMSKFRIPVQFSC